MNKGALLITSNFAFSNNIFLSYTLLERQNAVSYTLLERQNAVSYTLLERQNAVLRGNGLRYFLCTT